MRVFRLGAPTLLPGTLEDAMPEPRPAAGEILIRVAAVGVTPTELQWYPTTHTKAGAPRSRAVPGHEFSGVVAALGAEVKGLEIGQAVYGMNDWFADGATAEYCITQPQAIAPRPTRLTHAQAASVPIGALTAWQGLFDRVKLKPAERVLIHGGSGAVGVYAVQLARRHGAQVIASASAKNLEFLKELGAQQVIDYRADKFEAAVGQVDVVFDCVGGETLRRSWDVLAPGGRLVTIAADSEGKSDDRTKAAFLLVEAKGDQLSEIGRLLDAGELQPVVDCVVPLALASDAYAGKLMQARRRGKVVVEIAPQH